MKTTIKIVIAALLFLCLANMPYGFYMLVRFTATIAFAYLSYEYFKSKQEKLGVLFAFLGLLFQPFFKVALGRMIWNCIDVVVAIVLLYLIIIDFRKKANCQ